MQINWFNNILQTLMIKIVKIYYFSLYQSKYIKISCYNDKKYYVQLFINNKIKNFVN